MGPSFIRSGAGDRCTTGNSPTLTRRLNLKWNYSLDGWLLRQAWQQWIKNIDNLPNEILTCRRVFLFTAYLFPTSVASKQDFNASGCWIFKDASLTLLLTFARSADDQWRVGRSGGNITSEGMHYSYVTYDKEVSFISWTQQHYQEESLSIWGGPESSEPNSPIPTRMTSLSKKATSRTPVCLHLSGAESPGCHTWTVIARAGCFWHLSRW